MNDVITQQDEEYLALERANLERPCYIEFCINVIQICGEEKNATSALSFFPAVDTEYETADLRRRCHPGTR